MQIGKLFAVRLRFVVGNVTKGTGIPTFTIPVAAVSGAMFGCQMILTDTGTDSWYGFARIDSGGIGTGSFGVNYLGTGNNVQIRAVTNALPFTWAATDIMELSGPLIYQAA
jgi:hypothetical protein